MLEDLEKDMQRVFSRIGRTEESMQAERFIEFVQRKGTVPYFEAYNYIRNYFPDFRDFEGILAGAIQAGQLSVVTTAAGIQLQATKSAVAPPAAVVPITPDTKFA
jgi:hypothetical protein